MFVKQVYISEKAPVTVMVFDACDARALSFHLSHSFHFFTQASGQFASNGQFGLWSDAKYETFVNTDM